MIYQTELGTAFRWPSLADMSEQIDLCALPQHRSGLQLPLAAGSTSRPGLRLQDLGGEEGPQHNPFAVSLASPAFPARGPGVPSLGGPPREVSWRLRMPGLPFIHLSRCMVRCSPRRPRPGRLGLPESETQTGHTSVLSGSVISAPTRAREPPFSRAGAPHREVC